MLIRSKAGKTAQATNKALQTVTSHLRPPPITQHSNPLRGLAATVGSSDFQGSNPPAFVIASAALVEC